MTLSLLGRVGLLVLTAMIPGDAQNVSCTGIPTWIATKTYQMGDSVVFSGKRYKALVSTTNVRPDYCPACGWWKLEGTCGTTPTCTTAPAVPTGLATTSITSTSVALAWKAVTAPPNCTVTYKVFQNGTQVATPSVASATVRGLKPNTSYTFTVAAVDQAGSSVASAPLTVKTPQPPACTTLPAVPTGLAASAISSSGCTLTWNPVSVPSPCSVTYTITQDGAVLSTVPTTTLNVTGLKPLTTYTFAVRAQSEAGASAPSQVITVKTTDITNPDVVTTGTLKFHLHLGVSSSQDQMVLDGDNYTDLIMSNLIAGVMCGHLADEHFPGLKYQKDYLYGSILGQLLQENIATQMYKASTPLIAPAPEQQAVMGMGQGGPYQINNYAVDMVKGTYTPGGYSLINFVALQKNLGYTMAEAPTQYTKNTPASFNNKYYSPMLTAYFHYLDFVALHIVGKGEGGWMTPWQPDFDKALENFKTLPDNFFEVLLNVAYNQGFYGPLMKRYSTQAATATPSTNATVRAYSSVWGKTDTYEQYPYQVMYYLDQLYGNPIPTTSPTTTETPNIHVAFPMPTLGDVFSKVFQTLAYVNGSGQYTAITAAQANTAFNTALNQAGVPGTAVLDLSKANDRARIFTVIEKAIVQLETNLGTSFGATTDKQL